MVNQIDSPDGRPRKDPDKPSPSLVETDPSLPVPPPVSTPGSDPSSTPPPPVQAPPLPKSR